MKLRELIKEEKEVNLIGVEIKGRLVTPETRDYMWHGNFDCSYNGMVSSSSKKLTTLKGAPKEINGSFYCNNNSLTSLSDGPQLVLGNYYCDRNQLTSLKGVPEEIDGYFSCDNNLLTSIDFAPKKCHSFHCFKNYITHFKDIHKVLIQMDGSFYCNDNPVKSHILGFLLIPGLVDVRCEYRWVKILNKYMGRGRAGLIECQNELIEAGLEEFAQI